MKFGFSCAFLILGFLLNVSAYAAPIDWSTVTLTGSFPSFSFSDLNLGTVNLTYSSDTENFGISNQYAEPTLILGNTGGESLTISWSNLVTGFDMEIWDIDAIPSTAGESVNIVTAAAVSPDTLNPTDVWSPSTQTLSSDGSANPNSSPDNFTVMSFFDASGFNSITFNWSVAGGTGSMGIGEIDNITFTQPVPEPATMLLLASGLVGLAGLRRKFRKN